MNKYRIKVTEKHTDHVWVDAENGDEALEKAIEIAQCEFECLYDCEIMEVQDASDN
jgi:hypothetical protein